MVFEEGLDISGLPETLKEDFKPLDRLEGQYRVTTIIMEVVREEKEGPLCPCSTPSREEVWQTIVEQEKPMIRLSKVIRVMLG